MLCVLAEIFFIVSVYAAASQYPPNVRIRNGGSDVAIAVKPPTPGYWIDWIVVQKSTDGVASWDNGARIGVNPLKNHDNEWLAVDVTPSPFRSNAYVG